MTSTKQAYYNMFNEIEQLKINCPENILDFNKLTETVDEMAKHLFSIEEINLIKKQVLLDIKKHK